MDLFRKFLKEQLTVQLYGKLPLARDYLRVGASKGAGRELREWLDLSFSSRAGSGEPPLLAWPMRLVMPSSDGEALMGSMWASSDSGSRRSFPFVTFVERRRKALAGSLVDELPGLHQIWNQLEECFVQSEGYSEGEGFLAAMRGRDLRPASESPSSLGERLAYEAWVAALWPQDGPAGLVETLTTIGRLIKAGYDGPLRLPLVSNRPQLPQVSAWHCALAELPAWPQGQLPFLAFPQEGDTNGSPPFATFLRGRLRTEDAQWLASSNDQSRLGEGDFARSATCLVPEGPVAENISTLTESVRGAMASARARI